MLRADLPKWHAMAMAMGPLLPCRTLGARFRSALRRPTSEHAAQARAPRAWCLPCCRMASFLSSGAFVARRLRISLGLKPLNMEQSKQSSQDQKRQEEERKKQEQERMAADLRARIAA